MPPKTNDRTVYNVHSKFEQHRSMHTHFLHWKISDHAKLELRKLLRCSLKFIMFVHLYNTTTSVSSMSGIIGRKMKHNWCGL